MQYSTVSLIILIALHSNKEVEGKQSSCLKLKGDCFPTKDGINIESSSRQWTVHNVNDGTVCNDMAIGLLSLEELKCSNRGKKVSCKHCLERHFLESIQDKHHNATIRDCQLLLDRLKEDLTEAINTEKWVNLVWSTGSLSLTVSLALMKRSGFVVTQGLVFAVSIAMSLVYFSLSLSFVLHSY